MSYLRLEFENPRLKTEIAAGLSLCAEVDRYMPPETAALHTAADGARRFFVGTGPEKIRIVHVLREEPDEDIGRWMAL